MLRRDGLKVLKLALQVERYVKHSRCEWRRIIQAHDSRDKGVVLHLGGNHVVGAFAPPEFQDLKSSGKYIAPLRRLSLAVIVEIFVEVAVEVEFFCTVDWRSRISQLTEGVLGF